MCERDAKTPAHDYPKAGVRFDREPCRRHLMPDWWQRAEEASKLKHVAGRGWHSLRRKFATELKHRPLRDLSHRGGWKEPQTVVKCYQRPDETTMRDALATRGRVKQVVTSCPIDTTNRHHPSLPTAKQIPPDAVTPSGMVNLVLWAWVELNHRPHAYQACALTT